MRAWCTALPPRQRPQQVSAGHEMLADRSPRPPNIRIGEYVPPTMALGFYSPRQWARVQPQWACVRRVGASPSRRSRNLLHQAHSSLPPAPCADRGRSRLSRLQAGTPGPWSYRDWRVWASRHRSSSAIILRRTMRRRSHQRGVCWNEQPAPILSLSRPCAPANAQSSRTTSDRTSSPMLARANEVRQHRGGIPANSDSRSSLNFLAAAAAADRAVI